MGDPKRVSSVERFAGRRDSIRRARESLSFSRWRERPHTVSLTTGEVPVFFGRSTIKSWENEKRIHLEFL